MPGLRFSPTVIDDHTAVALFFSERHLAFHHTLCLFAVYAVTPHEPSHLDFRTNGNHPHVIHPVERTGLYQEGGHVDQPFVAFGSRLGDLFCGDPAYFRVQNTFQLAALFTV